jgi:hypothetical protein
MASRFLKALFFSTWLYSLMLWLYIVARVVISGVDVHYPFVDSIQSISISEMGAASFLLSFVCLVIYMTFWGKLPWLRETSP